MNTVMEKVSAYIYEMSMEKDASSYNGIMSALGKRVDLAKSIAKTNPAKAGYLHNKTWNSFLTNSNAYKGRLGTQGYDDAMDLVKSMPSAKAYTRRVYEGMENAFKAGKPEVAGKILATKAHGKGLAGKVSDMFGSAASRRPYSSVVSERFNGMKPSEFGQMADTARHQKDMLDKGIAQTASVFHL